MRLALETRLSNHVHRAQLPAPIQPAGAAPTPPAPRAPPPTPNPPPRRAGRADAEKKRGAGLQEDGQPPRARAAAPGRRAAATPRRHRRACGAAFAPCVWTTTRLFERA